MLVTRAQITDGRVPEAASIATERRKTDGRVVGRRWCCLKAHRDPLAVLSLAGGVAKERPITGGRVFAAGGVGTQSECSIGGVAAAGGVGKEKRAYIPLAVFWIPVLLL